MVTSTPSSTLTLLDTNVLVYSVDSEASHHRASRALIDIADQPGTGLCVAPQNLAEFLAIATDSRRVHAPLAHHVAVEAARAFAALPGLVVLPIPTDILGRLLSIVERYSVTRQRIFDAYLVATMVGNGVRRIYTFNDSDFLPFTEIEVAVPHTPATSH